jgi:hypothetical protein
MQSSTRNLVGSLTSLFWIVAGVYMVFRGVDETWRLVGFAVIGVGVFRGAMLLRDWNRGKGGRG